MRETRSGSTTTPPMEFGPLRRHQFRWSLCRFTSPTPSALRVSHSLDGLFPPGPCGFVSRHIRPWDSDLQSFSLSTSRIASRRPLLSCRQISANSYELPPRLSSASVEAGSNRREPRLQSLTPAESPFPARQSLDRQPKPMLSWPFSPPRLTRPAVGLSPSPHVLTAQPPSTALRRERPQDNRLAALQGVNPTDPERISEEILQPP